MNLNLPPIIVISSISLNMILYNCVANVIAQQVCLVFVLRVHLLLVCGDIESNPGPTRYIRANYAVNL